MEAGVDIIRISRVAEAAGRGSFLLRAFSEGELSHYRERGERAETLAGIFAAKEAIIKALGLGITGIKLQEIEITYEQGGRPRAVLRGGLGERFRGARISVSIAHEGEYAIAMAILAD